MLKTQPGPSRSEIWKMFDTISSTYDRANRFMTMGLDLYWRKKMTTFLPKGHPIHLLDCATGTADQIISFMKHSNCIATATGIDLSKDMLAKGQSKLEQKSLTSRVDLKVACALDIPFPEHQFDCVTISFGIRNVTDVDLCLQEMFRVLKPGGRALILETSLPKMRLLKIAHLFYLRKVLPSIGGWISEYKKAYQYLNETTETFPSGSSFCSQIENVGFHKVECHPLTLGVVSIYKAEKPL